MRVRATRGRGERRARARSAGSDASLPRRRVRRSHSRRYTSKGFVVGGVEHQGNVFLYEELSLLWGVKTPSDVTPETLVAAHAVDPPPDLLIVGCGDTIEQLPEETVAFFRDTETTLEVLDTVRPTPRRTESPRRSHPATSGRSDPVVDLPAPSARVRRSRATLTRAVPRTTRSLPSQPNAIATYNILVQEGRQVAAAMILPSS